jgi:hypothetical protein
MMQNCALVAALKDNRKVVGEETFVSNAESLWIEIVTYVGVVTGCCAAMTALKSLFTSLVMKRRAMQVKGKI